jgi:hypothetical protein
MSYLRLVRNYERARILGRPFEVRFPIAQSFSPKKSVMSVSNLVQRLVSYPCEWTIRILNIQFSL